MSGVIGGCRSAAEAPQSTFPSRSAPHTPGLLVFFLKRALRSYMREGLPPLAVLYSCLGEMRSLCDKCDRLGKFIGAKLICMYYKIHLNSIQERIADFLKDIFFVYFEIIYSFCLQGILTFTLIFAVNRYAKVLWIRVLHRKIIRVISK